MPVAGCVLTWADKPERAQSPAGTAVRTAARMAPRLRAHANASGPAAGAVSVKHWRAPATTAAHQRKARRWHQPKQCKALCTCPGTARNAIPRHGVCACMLRVTQIESPSSHMTLHSRDAAIRGLLLRATTQACSMKQFALVWRMHWSTRWAHAAACAWATALSGGAASYVRMFYGVESRCTSVPWRRMAAPRAAAVAVSTGARMQ